MLAHSLSDSARAASNSAASSILCRSTQYDRAFNQFMLFARKAVSLHVDRFQNMLPYLCQLLMMHRASA